MLYRTVVVGTQLVMIVKALLAFNSRDIQSNYKLGCDDIKPKLQKCRNCYQLYLVKFALNSMRPFFYKQLLHFNFIYSMNT